MGMPMATTIIIGEPIRTVAPAAPAVEVWEVAEQARIDIHDEDALIERYIAAATEYVERYTGLGLVTQVWQLPLSGFPAIITLPIRPFQAVTSVAYTDADGRDASIAPTELADSALYALVGVGSQRTFGSIAPINGTGWPSGTAVQVDFAVGFGDEAADLPQLLRHAIIVTVATWHAQRLDVVTTELPTMVQRMLSFWKRPAFA
jgi:uncharacterized phiE125 gp8 family phage protein